MNVDKALQDLEKEAESSLYQWLESMVGEKGEAQVGEFFVMRITKLEEKIYQWLESEVGEEGEAQIGEFFVMRITREKLKEKIDERVKTELKEANQRIQALEEELEEYKANAKDIQEASELLRLKI